MSDNNQNIKMKRLIHLVLIIHFIWVLFLILGFIGLVFIKNDLYLQIYATIISLTLIGQIVFHGCPLTKLEDRFQLRLNGSRKYDGLNGHPRKCLSYYTRRFFGIEIADIYTSIITIVAFIITITIFFIR